MVKRMINRSVMPFKQFKPKPIFLSIAIKITVVIAYRKIRRQ